jgi:Ca-activated chloride channel family protein
MRKLVRTPSTWALVAVLGGVVWAWSAAGRSFGHMWLTPDQQGAWLAAHQRNVEAAARFRDPVRQGSALYRAGEYEKAAAAFARADSPEAAFDRGNALVMRGKYDDAIASYDRALARRPAWYEAQSNRDLALVRKQRMAPTATGEEDTGQRAKPDEIVLDDQARQPGARQTETVAGENLDNEQVQALWLRRVQTKPADFLRAKFAYQLSHQGQPAPPP